VLDGLSGVGPKSANRDVSDMRLLAAQPPCPQADPARRSYTRDRGGAEGQISLANETDTQWDRQPFVVRCKFGSRILTPQSWLTVSIR
jgi:hypothetical protein